jgi:MFS family permease
MPTDGTIFLEALPKRKHYLLTALSVFFAAGSVISSVMGLILIPRNSCGSAKDCDVANNKGWRWLLASLGIFTLLFVIARLVFFHLFESPKFLVSAGRLEEARSVLQRIADFNGQPKKVKLSDVRDQEDGGREAPSKISRWRPRSWMAKGRTSMQNSNEERQRLMVEEDQEASGSGSANGNEASFRSSSRSKTSWRSSIEEAQKRYAELFSPHWAKTTILVWSIWTVFTLAYTMVNIFLPKYLQDRSGKVIENVDADAETRRQNMESVMQEFLFYSLASLPGSLMGAYLIETSLGRIKSMAISTALLAVALLTFAYTTSPSAVIASSCSISLFASTSYAVIYSYSPEVFETSLRGTASGTASALSRMAGMLAPLLAGFLISISANLPLYLGFILFAITVGLELSLPYETKPSDTASG